MLSVIRDRLEGQIRYLLSYGQPLEPHVSEFITSIGILIMECYGMVEFASIIACQQPVQVQQGSVGNLYSM